MNDEPEPGEDHPPSETETGYQDETRHEDETRSSHPSHQDDSRAPGLRRARQDRYLGGVAGGAGRLLGIDPLVFRVAFAVATVWWRITPLVYAALWLTVREEGAERSLLMSIRRPGGVRQVVSVLALGVGAVAVGPGLSAGAGGDVRLGLLLLAVGAILILSGSGGIGPDPVSSRPTSGASTGAPSDQGPSRPLSAFVPGPPEGTGRDRGRWRGRNKAWEPREPARLGWLGFWLVVLLGGAALALDRADASIRPGVVVSLALLVVAACLLIGAIRGRARLLVPVGSLLAPLWVAFSLGAIPRYDGDGRIAHTPESVAQIEDRYTHGYGELRLDLTEVAWEGGETKEIELAVTGGEAEVRLPSDVEVQLDAAIGVGGGEILHRWEGDHAADLGSVDPDFWLGHGTMSLDSPARPPTCEELYERDDLYWEDDPQPADEPEWEPVHRDPENRPCAPRPAPENPAVVKLDVQIGIGYVEVRHVETPA